MYTLLMSTTFILVLILCILSILLMIKTNRYYSQLTLDKIKNLPVPICMVNLYSNEIIDYNSHFYNLFIKSNDKEQGANRNIELTNIFYNFEDYLNIKKISKNSTSANNKIIQTKIHDEIRYVDVKFSCFKLGLKKIVLLSFFDITDEVKSAKYLGVFTSIIENTPDGVLISRKTGSNKIPEIIYSNNKLTEITGYKKEEILNKPINSIFELNVEEKVLEHIKESIILMKPTELEFKYIAKNGEECWVQTNIIPIYNSDIKKSLASIIPNENSNEILRYINYLSDSDVFLILHQKDITASKEIEEISGTFINKLENIIEEKERCNKILSKILHTFVDYDKKNIPNEILKILAENLNADRAYIFDVYTDDNNIQRIKYAYGWTREGIQPDAKNIISDDITFEEVEAYSLYASLLNNKIYKAHESNQYDFMFKKIMQRKNIKSVIICPIFKEKELVGFIGLDDCVDTNRIWSKSVEKLLYDISKLLSIII